MRYYKGHIALSDARDVPILLHVRNARAICCLLYTSRLYLLLHWRTLMSPYYDQPGSRQKGPEDVVGVLVLFACAAVGFCWYVAVSRLHLRNVQCLEIFLYVAILFFGGGLIIAQLVGRRKKREMCIRDSASSDWHSTRANRSRQRAH